MRNLRIILLLLLAAFAGWFVSEFLFPV